MNLRIQFLSPWALSVTAAFGLTACMAVEADVPANPTVSFPAWSTAYDQTQNVQVTAAPGWSIDLVEYSVDGLHWMQATPAGSDGYSVVLTNLDIGDSEIAVRVTSSYRGQSQTTLYYSPISGVAPVFDCSNPATSMLPTPTLIRDVGTEIRTLVGYFGDPAGGHTVTFIIGYTNQLNTNPYQNVGSIVSYGRTSITAAFDVSLARCDTRPTPNPPQDCDVPYSLTVLVDGAQLCKNDAFDHVHNYAR